MFLQKSQTFDENKKKLFTTRIVPGNKVHFFCSHKSLQFFLKNCLRTQKFSCSTTKKCEILDPKRPGKSRTFFGENLIK